LAGTVPEFFHHVRPLNEVTESQNHRMLGVRRDLCGSSRPTPLPKQNHLEQAAQNLVRMGLEYLQRRRIHNLPGQPVPVLCHPQSEGVTSLVSNESIDVFLPKF